MGDKAKRVVRKEKTKEMKLANKQAKVGKKLAAKENNAVAKVLAGKVSKKSQAELIANAKAKADARRAKVQLKKAKSQALPALPKGIPVPKKVVRAKKRALRKR